MKKMGIAIMVITLVVSTIFLVMRFGSRPVKLGASQAALEGIEQIKNGAFVLDVRTVSEYNSGSYPNSVNIPLDAVSTRLSEIPKDKCIVVYCASGGRSASARDILLRFGYKDVINAGGLKDLENAAKVIVQK
ncbi:rhodanese-like domain-containing protein [Leptospira sp. GIMC2001]|uniref:rhodanese-like domain-containing protein n=1 Tax=Leptospira sp. GIMC2001 TaxID=1513297 RepID=UPI00234B7CCC|nr:rhodanese-like domain-containing protein [Leptospira sp. GIMC2001]WCL49000.1 rhodanese-like domain-containing protein [Leptospira sp. GIMC2001]